MPAEQNQIEIMKLITKCRILVVIVAILSAFSFPGLIFEICALHIKSGFVALSLIALSLAFAVFIVLIFQAFMAEIVNKGEASK